jgi:glutathione S-transferase
MSTALRHYGWECSPYSSKTRAYLRYKQIPHQDIYPTLWTMKRVIEAELGYVVMPIVVLADGTVLQDSSHIVDQLELEHPNPSITPPGKTQQLVSLLIELHADEWLPIIAMHTRWNLEENRRFAVEEFGRCALPWLPGFISRRFVQSTADKMSGYRSTFGITEATGPEIDAWTNELLDTLDAHFTQHPYLLGGRPCMGDFALYGPLYAHVWRDPGSRQLVESRPQVLAWINRMREPDGTRESFLADDEIPETLLPILARMFKEQFPVLQQTVAALSEWLDAHPEGRKVPRGLGPLAFQLGEAKAERTMMSYQQWQLQRPLGLYQSLEGEAKTRADALLEKVGGLEPMQLELKHRLTRKRFRVVVER